MALPASNPNAQWPPAQLDTILPAMGRWSAWFSNDLERLQHAYGGGIANPTQDGGFFASQQGGIKAAVARTVFRWFVGQAPTGVQQNTKLAVPIAAEVCQASADLLFADPVTISGLTKKAQARAEELTDEEFYSTIAEAAEIGAALGGVYLRVTWDDTVNPDGPFTTIVDADQAVPEFKWGQLVAVTFWSVVHRDGKLVYRHLERHELTPLGVGVIRHGLYEGEDDKLGTRVSLVNRPETAALAALADLNDEGTIDTKSPGLAVQYVPNQTPNRAWRHDKLGRNLGRSDLDGVEHLLDQLAETMSDWMRARRVARARIMIGKDLLKSQGPGQPAIANTDQEIYTELAGALSSPNQGLKDKVELLQPKFDPAGYKATAQELVEQILQMCGYSLSTFGITPDEGGDRTATEIEARERRSLMTRARKIRGWKPALRRHLIKLLDVDRAIFGHAESISEGLEVEFPDGVQESQLKLAQTVQALYASESASVFERVSILHPDWDDTQISKEVDRIREEFGSDAMSDPNMEPFDRGGDDDDEAAADRE